MDGQGQGDFGWKRDERCMGYRRRVLQRSGCSFRRRLLYFHPCPERLLTLFSLWFSFRNRKSAFAFTDTLLGVMKLNLAQRGVGEGRGGGRDNELN